MTPENDLSQALRKEFSDWRPWLTRALVLTYAAAAGLTVVLFTWMTERAFDVFLDVRGIDPRLSLLAAPLLAAGIVWLTRRYAAGAAGSGIPQVMAALDTSVSAADRGLFVSLRLALAKLLMTSAGLLGGLSLGREGPSVQIAAGVMHNLRRWLPERSTVSDHGLLVAGGAAGIAAAFNAPLAGVMFAIEELSRKPEQRSSGLIMAAIVLAGLMAVSVYGNSTYFGVIRVPGLSLSMLLPGLCVALSAGVLGGLFSRLLIASSQLGGERIVRWRARRPVAFAAVCGLAVAIIGLASHGATWGSGYGYTRDLLEGQERAPALYVLCKFVATWLTAWSGVPGGIFAPALAIGAGVGNDIAQWTHSPFAPTLIALGMAGFLAAATQAPLTSFIIVMEMVDGHAMVLSLMACAMVASLISRLISPPLYTALSMLQLRRLPSATALPSPPPAEGLAGDRASPEVARP